LTTARYFHIVGNVETTNALAALSALSQEHRLAIFRVLVEQGPDGLPAGMIGERLQLAPATLSFHLKELSHAGLIAARQNGRFIYYRADYAAMNGLVAYLTENCCRASTCAPACAPPKQGRANAGKRRPSTPKRRSA
jgi:DNA-binding transcriptional ArsR family regulator